jgi:hypothetical protein
MKTLSFALYLILSSSLFAQVTTETETERNRILTENSAKAKEIQDKQNPDKPQSTLNSLTKKKLPSEANLTDQDKQLSENYVHQGMANRIMKENCSGDNASVCMGEAGDHKFMGMSPSMVKAVASMYAMFGALGGDSLLGLKKGSKPDAKSNDGKSNDTAKNGTKEKTETASTEKSTDKKEENATDYCKYIPTVTEGVATITQMGVTKDLSTQTSDADTAQRDGLLKAAKSHDSRAKMAQLQAAGWFGGAACYAGSAVYGNFAVDKNLVIKIGAATFLGSFYQSEVSANKGYAEKMRKIADQLPGKGDCNPITDNLCYCSQPETENDPQYCMKQLHAKAIAKDSYRIACTDNNLKVDPSCSCEKSNTCFETYLEAQGQGALELGNGYVNSPFKSIKAISHGELEGGILNSRSFDKTSAIAKKALNELGNRFPASPLSPAQKQVADALASRGIPANVAALMASNSPSQKAVDAAMAKLNAGGMSGTVDIATPASRGSNIIDFSGGNGLGVRGETAKKAEGNDFSAMLKTNDKKVSNSKLIEFAQRAEAQANKTGQIRRDDDRPLFEIISTRYQLSGRKLLQVEGE